MAGKIVFTHGLPGSGKSTWAESQVAADPQNSIRVNRDDIRTDRFGEKYHQEKPDNKKESEVSFIQQTIMKRAFRDGKTVYCDDTNMNPRNMTQLLKLASDYNAEIEQKYFNVPVEECKRRNRARGAAGGRLVPEYVIDGMASRGYDDEGNIKEFVISPSKNQAFAVPFETRGMRAIAKFNEQLERNNPIKGSAAVIIDVDGTLANNNHHAAYAFRREGFKKDYPYFFKSIAEAQPNPSVRDLANRMRDEDDLNLVVLTGRDDRYARELIAFIERSGVKASRVIAKRDGDGRPDFEFKSEQLAKLRAEGLAVVHSLDDRPQSVQMWAEHGILVSQVPYTEHMYDESNPGPFPPQEINTFYGTGTCLRCGSPLKSGNIGPKCRLK